MHRLFDLLIQIDFPNRYLADVNAIRLLQACSHWYKCWCCKYQMKKNRFRWNLLLDAEKRFRVGSYVKIVSLTFDDFNGNSNAFLECLTFAGMQLQKLDFSVYGELANKISCIENVGKFCANLQDLDIFVNVADNPKLFQYLNLAIRQLPVLKSFSLISANDLPEQMQTEASVLFDTISSHASITNLHVELCETRCKIIFPHLKKKFWNSLNFHMCQNLQVTTFEKELSSYSVNACGAETIKIFSIPKPFKIFQALSYVPHLKHVFIYSWANSYIRVADGFSEVLRNTKLESLSLGDLYETNTFNKAITEHLQNQTWLTRLQLCKNGLNKESWIVLRQLLSLNVVKLLKVCFNFDFNTVEAFQNNHSLESLDCIGLFAMNICHGTLLNLNKNLLELNLHCNGMQDESLKKILIPAIKFNNTLKVLGIASQNVSVVSFLECIQILLECGSKIHEFKLLNNSNNTFDVSQIAVYVSFFAKWSGPLKIRFGSHELFTNIIHFYPEAKCIFVH